MKATVSGELFTWALSKAFTFIGGTDASGDLIEIKVTKKGVMHITGTGKSTGVRFSMKTSNHEPGKALVSSGQVRRVAAVVPKAQTIKVGTPKGGQLVFQGVGSKIGLNMLTEEESINFPKPPTDGWAKTTDIAESVSCVSWAGLPGDHGFKSGVWISPEKIECSDGRKLARVEPGPVTKGEALLPINDINRIGLLFYDRDEECSMAIDDRRVWFAGGNKDALTWAAFFTTLASKWPDTSKMMFEETDGIWNPHGDSSPCFVNKDVPRKALLSSASRIFAASTETYFADVIFEVKEDILRASSGAAGDVHILETLPMPPHAMLNGLRIGSQYLKAALSKIPGDTVDVLWGTSIFNNKIPLFELRSKFNGKKYMTLIMPRMN